MNGKSDLQSLADRIDAVRDGIHGRMTTIAAKGGDVAAHLTDAGKLADQAGKIHADLKSGAKDGASEIARDVSVLEENFAHWVSYVDRHFNEQFDAGPG